MDTYASTVAQNETAFTLKGKRVEGETADLPKPDMQDWEDTKSLIDHLKSAKHLESEEVEASSLKHKSSQQGTETTKMAQTSNIFTGDLSWIGHASPPVEKIDDVIEDMLKPEIEILPSLLELEILAPPPTVSPPTFDSDESIGKLPWYMSNDDGSIWELMSSYMSDDEESREESRGVPFNHHSDESIGKLPWYMSDDDGSIWELMSSYMSDDEESRGVPFKHHSDESIVESPGIPVMP